MAATKRRPVTLVLDWDGTITKYDTTALIGSRALAKASPTSTSPRSMSHYSDAYMTDYDAWKSAQASTHPESARRTIEDEIAHLSSSRAIEVASFKRVREAVLGSQNLRAGGDNSETRTMDEAEMLGWMQEGGEEALRNDRQLIRDPEGLKSLLARAEEDGNSWAIVSVSWSKMFIIGALTEAGIVDSTDGTLESRIWCNEVVVETDETDGEEELGNGWICSVQDKLAAFEAVGLDNEPEHDSEDDHSPVTIYVGDSTTDLACLAVADIGICMREEGLQSSDDRLGVTLQRLGVPCRHVHNGHDDTMAPDELLWTTTFKDIELFLHNLS